MLQLALVRVLTEIEWTHWSTGGSHLSWIFWEHENLSGLSVIQLIQLI